MSGMKIAAKRLFILSISLNLVLLSLGGYFLYRRGGLPYLATRVGIATGIQKDKLYNDMDYYNDRTRLFESLPKPGRPIVFVGDSITDGCEWHELLQNPNVQNRGISSDTTYGVLHRIDDIVKSKPARIFLMVGINDLAKGRPLAEILANYDRILAVLTTKVPDAQIYVESVLPINFFIYSNLNLRSNDQVVALNKEIKRLAEKYHLTYVDLHALMLSSHGDLNLDYTHDGIHINGKAYAVWKDAIIKYVK